MLRASESFVTLESPTLDEQHGDAIVHPAGFHEGLVEWEEEFGQTHAALADEQDEIEWAKEQERLDRDRDAARKAVAEEQPSAFIAGLMQIAANKSAGRLWHDNGNKPAA